MNKQKLDIFKVLSAIDNKNYQLYDNLTDEERKGFTAFITMKWLASVNGSHELEHYYLAAVNHFTNKNLFDINKHPKLQYLTLVASAPGVGKQRHQWLKVRPKAKDKGSEIRKELAQLFPAMKDSDLDVLSNQITKRDLTKYKKELGNE
jgi:hypothetical protein